MGGFSGLFSDYKKLSTGAGRYAGEFDAWQPIKSYAKVEQDGYSHDRKLHVEPILATVPLPANQPMQNYFEDIAKRCWKAAKPSLALAAEKGKVKQPPSILAATRVPQKPVYPAPLPGLPKPAYPAPQPPGHMVQVPLGRDPLSRPAPPPQALGGPHHLVNPLGSFGEDFLNGLAKDWQRVKDLERINAYTFRGDKREPVELMKAGGFKPPASRTDDRYLESLCQLFKSWVKSSLNVDVNWIDPRNFAQALRTTIPNDSDRIWWGEFLFWKAIVKGEKLHAGRMVANQPEKGYISTSRNVEVAKVFSGGGWVYVVLVEGGMVIPEGPDPWNTHPGEQEISYPVPIPWEKIYGFRKMNLSKFATGEPLYLRKGFQEKESKAFKECYAALSGKPPRYVDQFKSWMKT